jgi:hypothetical protein
MATRAENGALGCGGRRELGCGSKAAGSSYFKIQDPSQDPSLRNIDHLVIFSAEKKTRPAVA